MWSLAASDLQVTGTVRKTCSVVLTGCHRVLFNRTLALFQLQEIKTSWNLVSRFHSCSAVFIILPKHFFEMKQMWNKTVFCIYSGRSVRMYQFGSQCTCLHEIYHWTLSLKLSQKGQMFVDANRGLTSTTLVAPVATFLPHLTYPFRLFLHLSGSCLWIIPRTVAGK